MTASLEVPPSCRIVDSMMHKEEQSWTVEVAPHTQDHLKMVLTLQRPILQMTELVLPDIAVTQDALAVPHFEHRIAPVGSELQVLKAKQFLQLNRSDPTTQKLLPNLEAFGNSGLPVSCRFWQPTTRQLWRPVRIALADLQAAPHADHWTYRGSFEVLHPAPWKFKWMWVMEVRSRGAPGRYRGEPGCGQTLDGAGAAGRGRISNTANGLASIDASVGDAHFFWCCRAFTDRSDSLDDRVAARDDGNWDGIGFCRRPRSGARRNSTGNCRTDQGVPDLGRRIVPCRGPGSGVDSHRQGTTRGETLGRGGTNGRWPFTVGTRQTVESALVLRAEHPRAEAGRTGSIRTGDFNNCLVLTLSSAAPRFDTFCRRQNIFSPFNSGRLRLLADCAGCRRW